MPRRSRRATKRRTSQASRRGSSWTFWKAPRPWPPWPLVHAPASSWASSSSSVGRRAPPCRSCTSLARRPLARATSTCCSGPGRRAGPPGASRSPATSACFGSPAPCGPSGSRSRCPPSSSDLSLQSSRSGSAAQLYQPEKPFCQAFPAHFSEPIQGNETGKSSCEKQAGVIFEGNQESRDVRRGLFCSTRPVIIVRSLRCAISIQTHHRLMSGPVGCSKTIEPTTFFLCKSRSPPSAPAT